MGKKLLLKQFLLFSTSCHWAEKLNTSDVNFGDCPPLDMLLVVNIQILKEKQFPFFLLLKKISLHFYLVYYAYWKWNIK